MTQNLKWVVFDLGNVLVRLNNPLMYQELARVGGCSQDELDKLITIEADDYVTGQVDTEAFCKHIASKLPAKPATTDLCTAFCCQLGEPFTAMEELVAQVSSRINTACLSNTVPIHWDYAFQHYPVMKYFLQAMPSHELEAKKPDLEMYQKAERLLNASGEEILFFDDSQDNVEGAQLAGWQAFQFSTPQACRDKLLEYDLL